MLAGIDRRGMGLLSGGHFTTDLAQGALPALLPFLVTKFDLTYTMAAALVLASTFASSIIQPLFGLWSDARGALWLLPAGVALAGVGMALTSVAPTYTVAILLVVISGIGVAAFHPEGSKFATYVSGVRRASGMSFFAIGGNAGFAVGPLIATGAILAFGLAGGLLLAVPGLLAAAVLLAVVPYLRGFEPRASRSENGGASRGRTQTKGMALVLGIVGFRSLAHIGLFAFIPLWEISNGRGEVAGTVLLAVFLFSGAIGTMLLGQLGDRHGIRAVMLWSFLASVPLILVYIIAGGFVGAIALAFAGGCIIGTTGLTVVLSQEYMPSRMAMASGLSIGFAIGLGGVSAVLLGAVADAFDLKTAVLVTALGPAVCVALTLPLPPVRRGAAVAPAASVA